jgi:CheY-like chemotaxis protein
MTRVLVIDDEATIRGLLRTILSVAGHEVFEAGDGTEALRLLEGQPVELVLCDLRMPIMDGLETIPRIRQLAPAARIVAMSGGGGSYGVVDQLDVALRLGATVALMKPFCVEELLAAIAKALAEG